MDEEIVVTVEVPPQAEPEAVAEVAPVVVVTADTPVDALVELAARVGALEARMDATAVAIIETAVVAEQAADMSNTSLEIAQAVQVDAIIAEVEEVADATIPEVEEIPSDVVAQEMPELEKRGTRRSYFLD